jgi:aminopeptidase-like protein
MTSGTIPVGPLVDEAHIARLASELLEALFPICRSLTGPGNRETLDRLGDVVPLRRHAVRAGERLFDWIVPPEWRIREAWIRDEHGRTLVDFRESNLHVVGYSEGVRATLTFDELAPHLHSLPATPDAIPYRTAYFSRTWGFCLSAAVLAGFDRNGRYEVLIDAEHDDAGVLDYADAVHPGRSSREILISTYCCHPSLANDNVSGLVLATLLFAQLRATTGYYTYRLVIAPETLGAIAYIARHQDELRAVAGGAVVTTVGGPGRFGLKRTFLETSEFDRCAVLALDATGQPWRDYAFTPDGSDERQYATPGVRIPTLTITKDKYYEYAEYHTSKDDLSLVRPEALLQTLAVYRDWLALVEMDRVYERTVASGEYQLGRRGLYPGIGGTINQQAALAPGERHGDRELKGTGTHITGTDLDAMNWLMFGCDGHTSLLSLSERSRIPLQRLHHVAQLFVSHGLLREVA